MSSEASLLELAERALGHAGADAQVTVTSERSLFSRFARSTPTQATAITEETVQFTCLRDGHTASSSTNALDDESLRASAGRARAAAEAAARLSGAAGPYPGLPDPGAARGSEGYDAETARLAPEQAGRALRDAFAAAAEHGLEAFGIWTAGEVRTALASTNGLAAQDAVTDAHMRVICRDEQGRSGFAAQTARDYGPIDGAELASRAAAKIDRREPLELAPGEYPVVLGPEAVGTLLDFLGELAFNGLAHAEGRGALVDRLGARVAAPCINLSDSPRYAATLARAFDAEGVPKRPLPLIQDGVASHVVHDTLSAARAGAEAHSTGHALAPGGTPGGPVPTNLVLVGGGAADEEELMAPIEHGLYVTRLWYVNTLQERQTLLTGMTRDGTFAIEDGRLGRPVRDVRFSDSVLRILSATEALGAVPRLVSEAEFYDQRFAYGVVCPPLRAQGFRVTGSTVE